MVITFSRGDVGDSGGKEVRRVGLTRGGGVVEVEVEVEVMEDEPDVWRRWTKQGVSGMAGSAVRGERGCLGDMKLSQSYLVYRVINIYIRQEAYLGTGTFKTT